MEDLQNTRRTRGRRSQVDRSPATSPAYIRLSTPFVPQSVYSSDRIAAIHDGALRILEELGIKILLDEARQAFKAAGARVDEDSQLVRIGREIVESALATAPRSIRLKAANPAREQDYTLGSMLFMAGAGCPNAFDRERGRRPGDLQGYLDTLRLQQSFDVIHMHGPSVEPQDVPLQSRHYAMMRGQLENCDKPVFVYSRGRQQVEESFEMIRLARGLDKDAFANGVWATTVINSNSPRQLDVPMSRGIIDFARAGQMSIITPFCLAGAMAPITISGALMLQHAEALAGIALAQISRAGAPVSYGGFLSNVDMRSGSPAFGTPEHIKACIGSGQLARHIGLPWRSATGAASNLADAQGAAETVMALWGAVLGGATVTVHAAGWLEGGLTLGYEKFILDIEALQTIAELTKPEAADDDALGFDAIAEVSPGGHFFSTAHTMERYKAAFYRPLVADLSNYGAWVDAGSKSADQRATDIWKQTLAEFQAPSACHGVEERLEPFIRSREDAGGAPLED
ncbi:trimethylamine methyltransferase family protein [Rhizobium miluonense]|uniref:Methyltransferase n=1 Tax=Rhizobium miluonense TaxID=411945 RepID=A0A1C3V7T8_9HYPH|nr:trimethylamine methyltransferase family protein [Rhizobium miluonense]SCB23822.1 trimethylamine---corrinoid protein Co-methyltransferase [Rhizobium miluonense]